MERIPTITAMAVDENTESRKRFCSLVSSLGITVVAESGYGINAPRIAAEHSPDLVFVAVEDPTPRAVQAIVNLRRANPSRPIIAYSSVADLALFRQVMPAGANDFLPTPLEPRLIREAVANVLRSAKPEARPKLAGRDRGTIVSIFGPKGGIGKTTISTNMAVAVQRASGGRVLLVDLDLYFGDAGVLLEAESRSSTADLARIIQKIDHAEFFDELGSHGPDVSVLSSATHPSRWGSASPDELQALLDFATGYFDYIIVDTPGTFSDSVAVAIEMADIAVAVTSMDMSSIKDTLFVIEFMAESDYPSDRVNLVVNHTNPASEISRTLLEDVLSIPIFWEIPYDVAIGKATQGGKLVVEQSPESSAAQLMQEMADRLVRTHAAGVSPSVVVASALSHASEARPQKAARVTA